MEYLTLSHSDLRVSRLCLGGCPMGGHGWGEVQEQELLAAVHAALDGGVTFFDTADVYGLGQSERLLGKALAARRHEVVIASKFGVCVGQGATRYDNSPDYIRKALEGSLQRLHTDYLDLYQLHYRDGVTPLAEVCATLEQLRQEGKIRYFGLSNILAKDFDELSSLADRFVSVQDEYSLACRKHERELQVLRDQFGLTPLTWGSLGQGILTGKYGREVTFASNDRRSREVYVNFHGEKLLRNLEIVEAMRPLAQAYGKSVAAVAIRFILDYLHESVVLVGAKRPDQVHGNVDALGWHLAPHDIAHLEKLSRE